jgi:hypothetical protein
MMGERTSYAVPIQQVLELLWHPKSKDVSGNQTMVRDVSSHNCQGHDDVRPGC